MATIYTTSKRDDVEYILRHLPEIISGSHPDPHGIASSLRSRVAFSFFAQVAFAFEDKGRGRRGSDDIEWKPLSQSYLAYQRPKTGRGRPLAKKLAPGGNDGLLDAGELATWNKLFAKSLRWLAKKYPLGQAKGIAAGHAWNELKRMGAKTKFDDPGFGKRVAGKDYQMLVSTGTLRRSILPGTLTEKVDGTADYASDEEDQVTENYQTTMVVGTRVPYAEYLHKLRPLWPEELPPDWIDEIDDAISSGIHMFVLLTERGEI